MNFQEFHTQDLQDGDNLKAQSYEAIRHTRRVACQMFRRLVALSGNTCVACDSSDMQCITCDKLPRVTWAIVPRGWVLKAVTQSWVWILSHQFNSVLYFRFLLMCMSYIVIIIIQERISDNNYTRKNKMEKHNDLLY